MSWTKILTVNFLVLFLLIMFLEVFAGLVRIAIGKHYIFPSITTSGPCEEMKTDVLLSHVHNHRSLCQLRMVMLTVNTLDITSATLQAQFFLR